MYLRVTMLSSGRVLVILIFIVLFIMILSLFEIEDLSIIQYSVFIHNYPTLIQKTDNTIKTRYKSKHDCEPKKSIIFGKTHKTGSTTIQNILFRWILWSSLMLKRQFILRVSCIQSRILNLFLFFSKVPSLS